MLEALNTPATGATYTVLLLLLFCHQWIGDWIHRHIDIDERGCQQLRIGSSVLAILLLLIAIFYHDESYISMMYSLVSLYALSALYAPFVTQSPSRHRSHLPAFISLATTSSLIVINRPLAPLAITAQEHLWTSPISITLIIIWLLATRPPSRTSQ